MIVVGTGLAGASAAATLLVGTPVADRPRVSRAGVEAFLRSRRPTANAPDPLP